jgi:hypothetical protein
MLSSIGARLEIPAGDAHDGIVEEHCRNSRRAGTILAHRIS